MNGHLTLAGLAFAAATSTFSLLALTAPATAAGPSCQFGFQTIQKESWILKCRKTVPMAQKGVALTQAGNANCTTDFLLEFRPGRDCGTHPPQYDGHRQVHLRPRRELIPQRFRIRLYGLSMVADG